MTTTALVKSDDAVFRVMDRLDEQAYLDELKGRVVDSWVYHFSQGGKELWGLSKVGIDEASSELAKAGEVIRELDMQILADPDPEYERYVVKAGRFAVKFNAQTGESHEILLETVFGAKRQAKMQTLSGGKSVPNTFYFEQGAMKAARNARARLIPANVKARIIALAKDKGRVRKIGGDEMENSGQDAVSQNENAALDAFAHLDTITAIPDLSAYWNTGAKTREKWPKEEQVRFKIAFDKRMTELKEQQKQHQGKML